MQPTKGKHRRVVGRSGAHRTGKKRSFRDLKAFGIWSDRRDLKDSVHFTSDLRARMERSIDAR